MTAPSNKRSWMIVGLGALLFVVNLLAYLELSASQASARAAADNLAECKVIAGDIANLRRQPSKVTLEAHSATELSSQVEQAMKFAQLRANCLVRVDPQPARRMAVGDFKEQATSLELRSVSLKQLIHFLHKLETGGAGLRTKSLQMASVKAATEATTETWNVQVVLTSLIFAPKKS